MIMSLTSEQIEGISALVREPAFALFDAPGSGKSRMVIEAAEQLRNAGTIDTVLVVCPAAVRISWADPEFGEIQKWAPATTVKTLRHEDESGCKPPWMVCSYEFARDHYKWLIVALAHLKVMLVADESIRIKNPTAKTTKAMIKLSDAIGARKVVLNGTPGSMLDCWGQYRFLGEAAIAPYVSFYGQWRPHFSVWMTRPFPKLIKFINHTDFVTLTKDRTLMRPKSKALPQQIFKAAAVTLDAKTWKHYREMKDEMITWLEKQPNVASNVGVQVMRLGQITSGYISETTLGSEKIDWALNWLREQREKDPAFRCIFWCQWRHELLRLQKAIPGSVMIIGGQSEGNRREAIRQFTDGEGSVLVGQPHAGGLGLNLVKAHNVVFLSRDYSQINREQAEDRTHRIGQEFPVNYIDLLAEGPAGQRTIDHVVLKALKAKKDLYNWTATAWLKELKDAR